jgi:hypothetical protein
MVGALLAISCMGAQAHHSGAMFDQSKVTNISGTVTEFNWQNPHATFRVDVIGEGGRASSWAVEMGSPNNLMRQGWKRSSLKTGDKVTVTVNPLRDGKPGGLFVSIVLADGTRLGSSLPGEETSRNPRE